MKSDSDLAYEILRSLRRILRKVSQHSRKVSQETGLTVPQMLCLRAIEDSEDEGSVTAVALSHRVRLSPPTVSRILERLERAGYVSRQRDTEDRRRVRIELTRLGRSRLERSPTPLQEDFLERLRVLPERDRKVLLESLERIVKLMEADEIDAAPMLTPEVEVRPDPVD
jgi:DNA-binding MarR family transcriptional regulator